MGRLTSGSSCLLYRRWLVLGDGAVATPGHLAISALTSDQHGVVRPFSHFSLSMGGGESQFPWRYPKIRD